MITLDEAQEIISKEFEKIRFTTDPIELYQPIDYILSVGGKRIRPMLTLIACSMFEQDFAKALPTAVGLEMFHNFTLIHDDIMDNANVRRNRQTVHKKWNYNVGILSGDAMCIKAYEQVMRCPAEVFTDVFWIFNRTAIQVCEGQQFDMNFENRNDVSVADYMNMIELKTAVLIAACLQIGALIGGASKKDSETLYEYGKQVGIAFQLQDDLLDVYADEKLLGKEIGKDIISNKKTYLLISALQAAKGERLASLNQWLSLKEFNPQEKVDAIRLIYDELNIRSLCKSAIKECFEKAEKLLVSLSVQDNLKKELRRFAETIKERVF